MSVLPLTLQSASEAYLERLDRNTLKACAERISERYRTESGHGKRLLTAPEEAAAYALVRMPATFGAIQTSLEWTLACCDVKPKTMLDCGAGSGAASWAAAGMLPSLERIICLEREPSMINLGKCLMTEAETEVLRQAIWQKQDLVTDELQQKAELVISAYVMNEMTGESRMITVDKLWNATKKLLLIVEPGTPEGYRQLMQTRERLLQKGAFLAAPCTHSRSCRVQPPDWCHFSARIQRSRIHRMLKDGEAPFEDEKFIYLAFTREQPTPAAARILRHPMVQKGRIDLSLCSAEYNRTISVWKRQAEDFRCARKSSWGDAFNRINQKENEE